VLKDFKDKISSLNKTSESDIAQLYYDISLAKPITDEIALLQSSLPSLFDIQSITENFPLSQPNSINSVVHQEINRYNYLLTTVKEDLAKTLNAMEGNNNATKHVETIAYHLKGETVPEHWQAPQLPAKELSEWLKSLNEHVKFFQDWAEYGQPNVFTLSVFWNVKGFLRAVKIRFAREVNCSFDDVDFSFGFTKSDETIGLERLYLENADWDPKHNRLIESKSNQKYVKMPTVV